MFDQPWFSVKSTPIFSQINFLMVLVYKTELNLLILAEVFSSTIDTYFSTTFLIAVDLLILGHTAPYQLIFKGWYWQLIVNASRYRVAITVSIQHSNFPLLFNSIDSQQLPRPTWVEKLLNHSWEMTNDRQHIASCWNTQPILKGWWNSVVNVLQN